jgi:hypothetical protein
MIDVTQSRFYCAKSTIINQHTIEAENNLFNPKTDRAYADRTTQVVVKRIELIEALKSARQNIWTTVDFNDDATLKVVDQEHFKANRLTISGLLAKLSKLDKAISTLDALGATSYDDVKQIVDNILQKVRHFQSKISTLEHSTRSSEEDLKKQIRDAKEEILATESTLKHHQDILSKLTKILAEVGL